MGKKEKNRIYRGGTQYHDHNARIGPYAEETNHTNLSDARIVKEALTYFLRDDGRVTSIGITGNHEGITVKVGLVNVHDQPDLPEELCGVPIKTQTIGHITSPECMPRSRWRYARTIYDREERN